MTDGRARNGGDRALTARILAAVGLKPGDVVDAARLDAAVATLAGAAGDHSGVLVTVGRMSPGPALSALVQRTTIPSEKKNPSSTGVSVSSEQEFLPTSMDHPARRFDMSGGKGARGADAVLMSRSSVGGLNSERIWRVKDGVVTPPEALDTSVGTEVPTSWELLILTAKDADILLGKTQETAEVK